MTDLALDTSVAVPYLLRAHVAHATARSHVGRRRATLTGQSLAETYSVLTRLPGDARVTPHDAIPSLLAPIGIAGGAVYDALVGLAAREAGLPLATRDRRAAATYAAIRVQVELVVT
jgi:predicted nucleic acid-binding protein